MFFVGFVSCKLDDFYILQSEPELGRGYADWVMTVPPQSRPRGMCDLRQIIGVGQKLRCAVVVAVGFERLVWRIIV